MKKFLSLVLALVMTMSLVTVSADAKDFTDSTKIQYTEAVDVMSAVKVIDGYAEGDFRPGNTLTGYAFMKMLLGALGYDVTAEGYTGANWSINVTKRALSDKVDLADGLNGDFNGVKAVTREEACLYAYNTMKAKTVDYSQKTEVINGNSTVTISGNRFYVTDGATSTIAGPDVNGVNYAEFAERYFKKLSLDTTYDDFGRPTDKWTYDGEKIGEYAQDPIATYTAKVSKGTLYDLLGKNVIDDYDLYLTINGVATTTGSGNKTTEVLDLADYAVKNASGAFVAESGKGVLVEVYKDTDAKRVDIAVITTYLAQATSDYSSKKENINVSQITKPAAGTFTSLNLDDFSEIKDLKEDDYILYTYAKGSVQEIAKAEVVSGTVNAYAKGDYVKLAGTQYDYAKAIDSTSKDTEYVVTDNAAVVLDAYGYVLHVDDASISTGNYIYIKKTATASKLIADAYFTDGTNKEITVKTLKNARKGDVTSDAKAEGATVNYAGWYSYSVNSKDEYTLTKAATNASTTSNGIVNNKTQFSAGLVGNSNTVFVVLDKDDNVKVYTGVKNVSKVTATGTNNITVTYMNDKDNAAKSIKLVFIDASKASVKSSTTDSLIYTLKLDSIYVDTVKNEQIHVWKVLKDGVEEKIETTQDWTVGTLYTNHSLNSDNRYEGGDEFAADSDDKYIGTMTAVATSNSDTMSYSGSILKIANGTTATGTSATSATSFITDENAKIVLVTAPAKDASGNVTTTGTVLANEIMNDSDASYETYTLSAKAMSSMFKGYTVDGTIYVTYDDASESDYTTTLYVVVTGAAATAKA